MSATLATIVGAAVVRDLDVDRDRAPVAFLRHVEADDTAPAPLDRFDQRRGAAAGRDLDEQPVDLRAVAAHDAVREHAQRARA